MPDNPHAIALIEALVKANKPVAAVRHAPVSFINIHDVHGKPLVKGKHVAGFTNEE